MVHARDKRPQIDAKNKTLENVQLCAHNTTKKMCAQQVSLVVGVLLFIECNPALVPDCQ